jgi:trimeric autotransporter adhesin
MNSSLQLAPLVAAKLVLTTACAAVLITEQETPFFLKHQNKVLAAELLRYKRTIGDLELRICAAQRKQRHFDATLSTVHRAWHQLDDDLSTVAKHILPPVAAAGAGNTTAAAGEQNALYEALLTSTAHLSLVDITDSAALKLTGVSLPQRTDADEPDPLVPSSDLSDGEAEDAAAVAAGGIAQLNSTSSSSSSSTAASEAVVGQVTAALAERLQFTNAVMGQVVAGMQRVFTTTTAASSTAGAGAGAAAVLSLSGLQTELLAQKRTLTAEVLLMRDQLSLAHQRARELSREVRAARRERHRALRKLEQLAAVGVAIPEDNAPLANKPLVPGSSPGAASAHRMSLSDGDAIDVSKLLSAVPALGSSSSAQQQQQQQMSTPGSTCQHTVPGGWSAAAAAAAGSSSSSGRTAAAAAAADAEGALSAQEAEALRADLAALTEAADRRLAEADQLRRDKVELEQEVTRLTARSPAARALAAVTGAPAGAAGADAAAAGAAAAAAEDAALQQQLLRHPAVLKLQLALDTAQKACASESARAAAAAARARELDTKLQQVNKAHETALIEMMQKCKAHCDQADKTLKEAVDKQSKNQDAERSAASEERTVKALTAQLEAALEQQKGIDKTFKDLETKVKTAEDKATAAQAALQRERAAAAAAAAAPSASAAVVAGEAARLQAELATTRNELAGANRTVDMLTTEVEASDAVITGVRNTNQRLMQTVADLEDSNLQLTQQIIQLKALLEQYAQEKVALDNRFAQAVGIEVSFYCYLCSTLL